MRSKIKIRTSSCSKANIALLHDEVRILIFDDPAEQDDRQRLVMVRSGQNPRARAARAPCMEKKYEIPRVRAARGIIRWFRFSQVYSIYY